MSSSSSWMCMDAAAHIKVYSYYEIDHSKLSFKTPHHLNFIRVVMVTEKTRAYVSLRYPSINSVRAYFNEQQDQNGGKKLPALDEKFTMEPELAGEALYRRILSNEFAVRKSQWRFWVSDEMTRFRVPRPVMMMGTHNSKKGVCLLELESNKRMMKWGERRKVRYLGSSRDAVMGSIEPDEEEDEVLYNVKVEEARQLKGKLPIIDSDEEDKDEDGNESEEFEEKSDDEEEEEEEEDKLRVVINDKKKMTNLKRKIPKRPIRTNPRPKRTKRDDHNQKAIVVYNQKKKKPTKTSIDRWSTARYKLAEESMLKILKQKGAVFGKPILRSTLRLEARRLIGDTGLLDHLLKHMAGKVAPGGEERFMRRHNSEGAMEYWLENANLVEIRKEAGVNDPYWTPPLGWKPGDSPSQDPICARDIKDLKLEVSKIKRDLQDLVSNKNKEDKLVVVATPSSCVTINQSRELAGFLPSLKEMYIDLMTKKSKIEEQLLEISVSVVEMEEGTRKLRTIARGNNQNSELLILEPETPLAGTERDAIEKKKEAIGEGAEEEEEEEEEEEGVDRSKSEEKAERIQRLKSGFRICKPQGSFLWPNMTIVSPQMVPTPPSVSSSSTIINLNEAPHTNQNDDGRPQSQSLISASPLTYQRRLHSNLITTATASATSSCGTKKEAKLEREEMAKSNSKQERKCSEGTWLALAGPSSSLDTDCKRG
ncbi:protein DYAD-like [Rutidosis leptorrhynchoides]|uniref:protein DYAD-like n=1 Tax=Rutidosis leptorrhynchoides TaxID=125765 RepID=UPI003A9A5990